jgi:hypothetical protein
MPRIRSVKHGLFRSRTLAGTSPRARLTFVGLWTLADDEGRYEYEPELLKADLWPWEEDVTVKDAHECVLELAARQRVCLYEHAGKTFLHVVNWHEHQKISHKTESRLPACHKQTHGGPPEDSGNFRRMPEPSGNFRPRVRAQDLEEEKEKEVPTHPEDYGPPLDIHKASVENLSSRALQKRAKLRDPQSVADALAPITGQTPSRPTRDQLKWREEADKRAAAERLLAEGGGQ